MKPILFQILIVFLILMYGCAGGDRNQETVAESVEETMEEASPEEVEEEVAGETDEATAEPTTARRRTTTSGNNGMTINRPQVVTVNPDFSTQDPAVVRSVEESVQAMQNKKLAVHCPRNMTYKKTSDVIAFVADLIDDDLIKAMMEQRVADATDNEDVDINDRDMLIRDLQLYEFIELRLDDADNEGFTIKKIHETDKQKVSENMEGWHWKVTPTTSDQEQQLVLKVIVYDQNGEFKSFDKTYRITIKIESGLFIRNTYALAVENPEWAFATIIIPFLTFLWGRYNAIRSRRKKEEKEEGA